MLPNVHSHVSDLSAAYKKAKITRIHIELIKTECIRVLDSINEQKREELHKNCIVDFLKKVRLTPDFTINKKERAELVILKGKYTTSKVGVHIEVKSLKNKTELCRVNQLNTKAFQELVFYYLREQITEQNKEIRHLIVTNANEWFLYNKRIFEFQLAQNKRIVKLFNAFKTKAQGK